MEIAKSDADRYPLRTFKPNDKDFEVGKRILMNNGMLYGQLYHHLSFRHAYGTKIAKEIINYLLPTDLGPLLKEHVKLIQTITEDVGKKEISGAGGILDRSALTPEAIIESMPKGLAGRDPFGRPREPMDADDTFAEAQSLFYETIKPVVRKTIVDNWNALSTGWQWERIHTFFKKVHKASPEYQAWESEHVKMEEWLDSREIGGYKNEHVPPRTKYHESDREVRSIPHIARDQNGPKVASVEDPTDDMEAMIDFFTDYITQVTFVHSFIHRTQYIDSPDVPNSKDFFFTPIALQNKGEGDDFITLDDAAVQSSLAETFENFPVDQYRLMDNEEVLPALRDAIKGIALHLEKLGYPLEHLTYSIVI
ncbi:MAG: hypothetical protein JSR46_07780, partial [Verrucomicrobia bacterium]|nr:hypothetical protein [Verrucomicrobiota bacterium]